MTDKQTTNYTEAEWERLRARFQDAALAETELALLGQNVGVSWPFRGSDETPARYLALDFEELASVPGLVRKPKRVRALMDILRETLAFDDPFADMADTLQTSLEAYEGLEKSLRRLGVPEAMPIALVRLDASARAWAERRGASTVGDLAAAPPDPSVTGVPDGGECLRTFLNALAYRDEATLARFLPLRPGAGGVHWPEAFGLAVRELEASARATLRLRAGDRLSEDEAAEAHSVSREAADAALEATFAWLDEACAWFGESTGQLREKLEDDEASARLFLPLEDPPVETAARQLARIYFDRRAKRGLLASLFGRRSR